MKVNHSIKSPNFDAKPIPVNFVVLHYSACGLQATFEIFRNPETKLSSHLVISSSGEVYEVVKCLDGEAYRAWHSGQSKYNDGERDWQSFNDLSIGIELINHNGNLIAYHDKQYEALAKVIAHLKSKYLTLRDPNRILGHEQIAGFRGKVDPGCLFDWSRFYSECYPDFVQPERLPMLPEALRECFEKFLNVVPNDEKTRAVFWQTISLTMEKAVELINK